MSEKRGPNSVIWPVLIFWNLHLFRPIGAVVYVEEALKNDNMFKISLRSIGKDDDTTTISQVCDCAVGGYTAI